MTTILFMINFITNVVTTVEFNTPDACLNAANMTDRQLPGVYRLDCYPKTLTVKKPGGRLPS